MSTSTEAKVAIVLDAQRLVITAGAAHGVWLGQQFAIPEFPAPLPIYDPDTQELLGVLNREKGRVRVVELHERSAVCLVYAAGSASYSNVVLVRRGDRVRWVGNTGRVA